MNTCSYCTQPIVPVIEPEPLTGTYVLYSPDHRGDWRVMVDNRYVGRFETQSDAVAACIASMLNAKIAAVE